MLQPGAYISKSPLFRPSIGLNAFPIVPVSAYISIANKMLIIISITIAISPLINLFLLLFFLLFAIYIFLPLEFTPLRKKKLEFFIIFFIIFAIVINHKYLYIRKVALPHSTVAKQLGESKKLKLVVPEKSVNYSYAIKKTICHKTHSFFFIYYLSSLRLFCMVFSASSKVVCNSIKTLSA